MAYQHISGRPAAAAPGTGSKVLAATPGVSGIITDSELERYIGYTSVEVTESPVKFLHFYNESKNCFVQSAVSYMELGPGKALSIAHTVVLSDDESSYLLNKHVCPFCPAVFSNAKPEGFKRPSTKELPTVDYKYLDCRDKDYNSSIINKFFSPDIFACLIMAMLLSAVNDKPVFIALPGSPKDASFNAIRIMNIIIPAFPAEYRKKLTFMTHVTDTSVIKGIRIYFTDNIDSKSLTDTDGYCFDLSRSKLYASGVSVSDVKEYKQLLRAVIVNIFSYSEPSLNEFFNDILPKLDETERFSLKKMKDLFGIWQELSVHDKKEQDGTDQAAVVSSFYELSDIVDDKSKFLGSINKYWENEVIRCKSGGYAPDIKTFDIINSRYPSFDAAARHQTQKIWGSLMIYSAAGGNTTLTDEIFSQKYAGSELVSDIYGYVLSSYIGTLVHRSKKTGDSGGSDAFGKVIAAYASMIASSTDTSKIFAALKDAIERTDRCYAEMKANKNNEYDVFSSGILVNFEAPINTKLTDAGMMRRFNVIGELKETIYGVSELGITVFEHFRSNFVSSMATCVTGDSVLKMSDDRKALSDLIERIEEYPELGGIETIAMLQRYWDFINTPREITSVTELNRMVNKPEHQKAFTGWIANYCKKYPELMSSVIANASCHIGDGANIVYEIDFSNAFSSHYDNINHDDDAMMRDINRLIPEIEQYSKREEYKGLGISSYKEPAARFIITNLLDRSADKKRAKENEANLRRYDNVGNLLASFDNKYKKYGKK